MRLYRYAIKKSRDGLLRGGPGLTDRLSISRSINIHISVPRALRPEKDDVVGNGKPHAAAGHEVLDLPCRNVDQGSVVRNLWNDDLMDDPAAGARYNRADRLRCLAPPVFGLPKPQLHFGTDRFSRAAFRFLAPIGNRLFRDAV